MGKANGNVRSTASAVINFGLVSVPVKFYTATESQSGLAMNLLHGKCGSRVKQQYICESCDSAVVSRDAMVKGYEYSRDKYVVFTPEELKRLEEVSSGTVEIAAFVPVSAVDPIYYDKPHYIGPDKGGAKALSLLREAMIRSERVAIGRWAARGKGYLVLLRPTQDGGIVMHQLLYGDEVRDASAVPRDAAPVKEAEVTLALKLVDALSKPTHDPAAYRDEVKARVQAAIDKKVAGEDFTLPPLTPAREVGDLMAALQASLAAK